MVWTDPNLGDEALRLACPLGFRGLLVVRLAVRRRAAHRHGVLHRCRSRHASCTASSIRASRPARVSSACQPVQRTGELWRRLSPSPRRCGGLVTWSSVRLSSCFHARRLSGLSGLCLCGTHVLAMLNHRSLALVGSARSFLCTPSSLCWARSQIPPVSTNAAVTVKNCRSHILSGNFFSI